MVPVLQLATAFFIAGQTYSIAPFEEATAVKQAQRVAEAYLRALEGTGPQKARRHLLGGVTLTAKRIKIPNWQIQRKDPVLEEEGELALVLAEMEKLDQSGQQKLQQIGSGKRGKIDLKTAQKVLAPTHQQASRFKNKYPVFAYVARVDRAVYWHPDNPLRKLLRKLGDQGLYRIELHRFHILETRAKDQNRTWPLRVLRITTSKYDSGWKILPASDWDPSR